MDMKHIKLCTSEKGEVLLQAGKFIAFDCKAQTIINLPDDENIRKHFNIIMPEVQKTQDIKEYHAEEAKNATCIKQQASWKDDNAVKALINLWKLHEDKFKNTIITNDKVWNMIAEKIMKENPLWEYTGKQCENKFKDVRKSYTRTRDNNVNKSGQDLMTCKFYDEMDTVLGEKPIIKPVAIASSLKKRKCLYESTSASSEDEEMKIAKKENATKDETEKPKKKSKINKELEKWVFLQQEATAAREQARERRHNERMQRQDEAIKAYQTAMNKLLDKL